MIMTENEYNNEENMEVLGDLLEDESFDVDLLEGQEKAVYQEYLKSMSRDEFLDYLNSIDFDKEKFRFVSPKKESSPIDSIMDNLI